MSNVFPTMRRIILATIAIFALIGCIFDVRGSRADVTTIRIYVGTNQTVDNQQYYQKVENLFNATHTAIQIKFDYRWTSDFSQSQSTLERYLRTTTTPDDLVSNIGIYNAMVTDENVPGAFEDLAPYLKNDAEFDNSLGIYRQAFQRGEKVSGLPVGIYPAMLFINPAAFKAAGLPFPPTKVGDPYVDDAGNSRPWDWDTVAEVAKRLTRDKNGNRPGDEKFNPGTVQMYGYADFYMTMRSMLGHWGVTDLGFSSDNKKAALTTDDVQKAVQWYQDAIFTGRFMPPQALEDGIMNVVPYSAFKSKKIGMWYAATWDYNNIWTETADFRIAALPAMPGTDGKTVFAPYWSDGIQMVAKSKNKQAAWEVIKWFVAEGNTSVIKELDNPTGKRMFPPTADGRKELWKDVQDYWFAPIPDTRPLFQALDPSITTPINIEKAIPNYRKNEKLLNDFFTLKVRTAKIADVKKSLDALNKQVQQYIDTAPKK